MIRCTTSSDNILPSASNGHMSGKIICYWIILDYLKTFVSHLAFRLVHFLVLC